jgi:hypothetical protein
MIIKAIVMSSALAACPTPAKPDVHALKVRVAPAPEWPGSQERLEDTEAPHGEGSGESPLYGGLGAYGLNINATNTSPNTITVDSGASGTQPYASIAAWLPNRLPLIVSTHDFNVVQSVVTPWQKATMGGPTETTRHLSNPSTIQILRS